MRSFFNYRKFQYLLDLHFFRVPNHRENINAVAFTPHPPRAARIKCTIMMQNKMCRKIKKTDKTDGKHRFDSDGVLK